MQRADEAMKLLLVTQKLQVALCAVELATWYLQARSGKDGLQALEAEDVAQEILPARLHEYQQRDVVMQSHAVEKQLKYEVVVLVEVELCQLRESFCSVVGPARRGCREVSDWVAA